MLIYNFCDNIIINFIKFLKNAPHLRAKSQSKINAERWWVQGGQVGQLSILMMKTQLRRPLLSKKCAPHRDFKALNCFDQKVEETCKANKEAIW